MPRRFPRVFLSVSLRPEDAKLVAWFRDMMTHLEFDVRIGDAPEPRPLTEKIKREIREADGFVAILTKRDKLEGRDAWKPPDWIHHEIGAAWQANKRFAIFRDRQVEVGGLIPLETTY